MRQYSACNIYPLASAGLHQCKPTPRLLPAIGDSASHQRKLSSKFLNQSLMRKLHDNRLQQPLPPRRPRNQLQQTVAFNLFRSRAYKKRPNQHIQEYNRKKTNSISIAKDVPQSDSPQNVHTVKQKYLHESELVLRKEGSLELQRVEERSILNECSHKEQNQQPLQLEPTILRTPIRKHISLRTEGDQPSPKHQPLLRICKRKSIGDKEHIRSLNFIRFVREQQQSHSPAKQQSPIVVQLPTRKCNPIYIDREYQEDQCSPWKTLPDEI